MMVVTPPSSDPFVASPRRRRTANNVSRLTKELAILRQLYDRQQKLLHLQRKLIVLFLIL